MIDEQQLTQDLALMIHSGAACRHLETMLAHGELTQEEFDKYLKFVADTNGHRPETLRDLAKDYYDKKENK